MENNQQISMAKIISSIVSILPAAAMAYILYKTAGAAELFRATGGIRPLVTALLNMTLFGMMSIIYFFAIGTVNSAIFKFVGRIQGSRWPKNLAFIGSALIWLTGIISSVSVYLHAIKMGN